MVASVPSLPTTASLEKPRNGLRGLKHWRYDLPSGLMVSMISLPFSMGIAITSGAPPVCGIVSAIIAGLLLPFLGGSYVTISGPAAGLAPALFAGMMALGHGNKETGYPLLLVAILLAGFLQIVLARMKVARLSAIFPAAAVEGMLAAIGLLIIIKQIPMFMGQKFEAHEFWEILAEIPSRVSGIDPSVFWLGIASVALLFTLAAIPGRLFKIMPPAVWVFVLGTAAAQLFLNIHGNFLITVPESPLQHGIVFPNFQGIIDDSTIWLPLAAIVITLLLIDGTESLATIAAVDKIDPFRRKSNPDRTLLAMGISNMASSVLGGLTIIPGIVKSTANILGGGRTQWANFYNACFLMIFLVLGRDLINMVPYCVLASILVFVGFKLCRPKVWRHMWHIGKEQFFIFAATVLITVTTDLLLGIMAGVAMKLALNLWYSMWAARGSDHKGLAGCFADLFRNPVGARQYANGVYNLYFTRPLVCFNLFHVIREMDNVPRDAKQVLLYIGDSVPVIDHTTCENLFHYKDEYNSREDKPYFEIRGLERMHPVSKHESSIHLARPKGNVAASMASIASVATLASMAAIAPEVPEAPESTREQEVRTLEEKK